MKAKEFLSELTVGRYASGGVTPMAPKAAFKKNSQIAYDIVKNVMTAPTTKEKFEILNNLTAGQTTNKIVLVDPEGKKYGVVSYDADTGIIDIRNWNGTKTFKTNVNDLEFKGKERSISSSVKMWIFIVSKIEQGEPIVKDPGVKKGRPPKAKPSSTAPTRLW